LDSFFYGLLHMQMISGYPDGHDSKPDASCSGPANAGGQGNSFTSRLLKALGQPTTACLGPSQGPRAGAHLLRRQALQAAQPVRRLAALHTAVLAIDTVIPVQNVDYKPLSERLSADKQALAVPVAK